MSSSDGVQGRLSLAFVKLRVGGHGEMGVTKERGNSLGKSVWGWQTTALLYRMEKGWERQEVELLGWNLKEHE